MKKKRKKKRKRELGRKQISYPGQAFSAMHGSETKDGSGDERPAS